MITKEMLRELVREHFPEENGLQYEYESHKIYGDVLRLMVKVKANIPTSTSEVDPWIFFTDIPGTQGGKLFSTNVEISRSKDIPNIYNHPIVVKHRRELAIRSITNGEHN